MWNLILLHRHPHHTDIPINSSERSESQTIGQYALSVCAAICSLCSVPQNRIGRVKKKTETETEGETEIEKQQKK